MNAIVPYNKASGNQEIQVNLQILLNCVRYKDLF